MCLDAHAHGEGSFPCLRSVFVSARQRTPPGHSAVAPHGDEQGVRWENLLLGGAVVVPSGVCVPLRMPAGVLISD